MDKLVISYAHRAPSTVTSGSRRAAIAFALGLGVSGRLFADTARDTLVAMAEYFGAAARLFAGAQSSVDRIDPAKLDPDARQALLIELESMRRALRRLLGQQTSFIWFMRRYADGVAENRFNSPAQREGAWALALRGVDQVADAAEALLEVVAQPRSQLEVVLTDADRLQLQSALTERVILLKRFRELPPPTTEGELTELGATLERYETLYRAAQVLQLSLESKHRAIAG